MICNGLCWIIFLFVIEATFAVRTENCWGMINVDDFYNFAKRTQDKKALPYYEDAALRQQTAEENKAAFTRLRIRPRVMRDVRRRDLSTSLLGQKVTMPIAIAPTAGHKGVHPLGENATAIACRDKGIVMALSTYSSVSLEEVAASAPDGLNWFQLHVFEDRPLTLDLIHRAEVAGYKALVLTVDMPVTGIRWNFERNHNVLPAGVSFPTFDKYHDYNGGSNHIPLNPDAGATWNDIRWIRNNTKLPIVVKGILNSEDALLAVHHGAAAVYVSNHGGRQLDGVPSTIEVLPEIVEAVNGAVEIYLDGGVRTGTDVFKALALGARAVFIGRPNIWGLTYQGATGAKCILEILKGELDNTMALAGYTDVKKISPRAVSRTTPNHPLNDIFENPGIVNLTDKSSPHRRWGPPPSHLVEEGRSK